MSARKYTNKLLEGIELGFYDRDTVILACVKYMSEQEVKDMMHVNSLAYIDCEEEIKAFDEAI